MTKFTLCPGVLFIAHGVRHFQTLTRSFHTTWCQKDPVPGSVLLQTKDGFIQSRIKCLFVSFEVYWQVPLIINPLISGASLGVNSNMLCAG